MRLSPRGSRHRIATPGFAGSPPARRSTLRRSQSVRRLALNQEGVVRFHSPQPKGRGPSPSYGSVRKWLKQTVRKTAPSEVRWFKSSPAHQYAPMDKRLSPRPFTPVSRVRTPLGVPVGCSLEVRAPGCGPGRRGFESRHPPHAPVGKRLSRRPLKSETPVKIRPGAPFTSVAQW